MLILMLMSRIANNCLKMTIYYPGNASHAILTIKIQQDVEHVIIHHKNK